MIVPNAFLLLSHPHSQHSKLIMHYSTALFALIASTFAAPLSKISPAPVVSAISSALPPRSTPVNNFKAAITGPVSSVTSLIGATKGSGVAAFKAVYQSINLNQVVSVLSIFILPPCLTDIILILLLNREALQERIA